MVSLYMLKKWVSLCLTVLFVGTSVIGPCPVYAQGVGSLPVPGAMVELSKAYVPLMIKGIKVDPKQPFQFEFIVDTGHSKLAASSPELKVQSNTLIKYFLTALTIPEQDMWVNLSPYEKDRMVPEALGQTEMGRDMLAQDYILKQLTASLIYPEKQLGKTFWDKVYAKAQALYGTSEVPVNTFNKVWIVADKADVFERGNSAYVVGAHLKVMLAEDYLALSKNSSPSSGPVPAATPLISVSGAAINDETLRPYQSSGLEKLAPPVDRAPASGPPVDDDVQRKNVSSQIIREIIIPALEEEVNEGKNFAPLRQMFYSMILASWYKQALKKSVMAQLYGNQNKVGVGIDVEDKAEKEKIYERYVQAYKKGVFNYIKEDLDSVSKEAKPRKYFSGGLKIITTVKRFDNLAMISPGSLRPDGAMLSLKVDVIVNSLKKHKAWLAAVVVAAAAAAGISYYSVIQNKSLNEQVAWIEKEAMMQRADPNLPDYEPRKEALWKEIQLARSLEASLLATPLPNQQARYKLLVQYRNALYITATQAEAEVRRTMNKYEKDQIIKIWNGLIVLHQSIKTEIEDFLRDMRDEKHRKDLDIFLKDAQSNIEQLKRDIEIMRLIRAPFDRVQQRVVPYLNVLGQLDFNIISDQQLEDLDREIRDELDVLQEIKVTLPVDWQGDAIVMSQSIMPLFFQIRDEKDRRNRGGTILTQRNNPPINLRAMVEEARAKGVSVRATPNEAMMSPSVSSLKINFSRLALVLAFWNSFQGNAQRATNQLATSPNTLVLPIYPIVTTSDQETIETSEIAESLSVGVIAFSQNPTDEESIRKLKDLLDTNEKKIQGKQGLRYDISRSLINGLRKQLEGIEQSRKTRIELERKVDIQSQLFALIDELHQFMEQRKRDGRLNKELREKILDNLKQQETMFEKLIKAATDTDAEIYREGLNNVYKVRDEINRHTTDLENTGRDLFFLGVEAKIRILNSKRSQKLDEAIKHTIQALEGFIVVIPDDFKVIINYGEEKQQFTKFDFRDLLDYLKNYLELRTNDSGDKKTPDPAMNPGGIDLNRSKMSMNITQDKAMGGVQMNVDQQLIEQIKQHGFDGFDFNIISITPLPSVLPVLGLREQELQLAKM